MINLGAYSRWIIIIVLLTLTFSPVCHGGRIKALLLGTVNGNSFIEILFKEEPLVEFVSVPSRDVGIKGGMKSMVKLIRLYFPRSYEEMKSFDYIMFLAPEFYLFTTKQDQWMHDIILEGAGGFNDGSVFSIIGQIHSSWANSLTQQAFPNDAPAVVEKGGGGESPGMYYKVVINRDFSDPVLTPYLRFGIEQVTSIVSRFVIPRETSGILAYQTGNFPGRTNVPYLIVWDYNKGRTMTCGGFIDFGGWFGEENLYSADMVMNMVFYSTGRELIKDVEIFHRVKLTFRAFRNRMEMLTSLMDFIDRFGANTQAIQDVVWELDEMGDLASEKYMDQDFRGCEEAMRSAFDRFTEAEVIAKQVKNSALFWVYIIEWLVTTSVLFISGFALWSLMVRRRLYRVVRTTRLA